jgi:hypothetical protein
MADVSTSEVVQILKWLVYLYEILYGGDAIQGDILHTT